MAGWYDRVLEEYHKERKTRAFYQTRLNTFYPALGSLGVHLGPSIAGGYVGAASDIVQFDSMLINSVRNFFAASQTSSSNASAQHSSSSANNSTSVGSGQSSALIGVINAFTPSNAAQAQALQGVFQAFAGGK